MNFLSFRVFFKRKNFSNGMMLSLPDGQSDQVANTRRAVLGKAERRQLSASLKVFYVHLNTKLVLTATKLRSNSFGYG
jgi:hypothetical protein